MHVQDQCSPKSKMLVYRDLPVLALSSDFFETDVRYIDLVKGAKSGNGPICSAVGQQKCATLKIMDALLIDGSVFLMTNEGLYKTKSLELESKEPIDVEFVKVSTGIAAVDTIPVNVRLFGKADCFSETGGGVVYIAYQESGNMRHFVTADVKKLEWEHHIVEKDVFGILPDLFTGEHIVLSGASTNATCSAFAPCLYTDTSVTIISDTTRTWKFEATTVLKGMKVHKNQHDIYVYGNELWHSVDNGVTFVRELEDQKGDVFEEFDSAGEGQVFAGLTKSGRVYYGRVGSKVVVPVMSAGWTGKKFLSFDSHGQLAVLSPLEGKMDVYFPPVRAYLPVLDSSLSLSLVPIIESNEEVFMYVSDIKNTGDKLVSNVMEQELTDTRGNLLLWSEISRDKKVLKAFVETEIQAEMGSVTLIVQGAVAKSGKMTGLDFTSAGVTVTIIGPSFTYADIGKALLVDTGSLLLTKLLNATSMEATVIKPFDNVGTYSSWAMYDFRPYVEYAKTADQVITLTNTGGNSYSVTLSAGAYSFDVNGMLYVLLFVKYSRVVAGMILTTTSGWAYVQYVISSNQIMVNSIFIKETLIL